MTAEIINLNRARKAKARAEKAGTAAANKMAFGRSKADRSATRAQAERAAALLDGAKRTPADVGSDTGGFAAHPAHDDDDLDPGNVS